jgi:hypothetical protein
MEPFGLGPSLPVLLALTWATTRWRSCNLIHDRSPHIALFLFGAIFALTMVMIAEGLPMAVALISALMPCICIAVAPVLLAWSAARLTDSNAPTGRTQRE